MCRAFSTGSTPGETEPVAAAAGGATASADDAKVGGGFPWRNAPDQVVAPAGSGSFLDGVTESIFEELCLKGVDFTVSLCATPCIMKYGVCISEENDTGAATKYFQLTAV